MVKIVVYIIKPENYFTTVTSILKKEVLDKLAIYVTTNKPYVFLINAFTKAKINCKRIFFIDCISRRTETELEKEPDNCIYLENPEGLTALSVAIDEALSAMKDGQRIVFLDSLSALLLYNTADSVGKFSNFITGKFRKIGADMVIFALRADMDTAVVQRISSFADEIRRPKD